jgi:hypothetical protein
MNDPLKLALWAGGLGLAVALVCAFWVVTANASSRNLVLGFGALMGACLVFLIQIYFELQESVTTEDFSVEITTDCQANTVNRYFILSQREVHSLIVSELARLNRADNYPVTGFNYKLAEPHENAWEVLPA